MRVGFRRAQRALVLAAAAAALAVPAALAGDGIEQVGEAAAPAASNGGQSSEIYLVELEGAASTFRKEAKGVGLKFSERFEYKRLFKGVAVRIDGNDVGKLAGIGSVANVYPARIYTLGPTATADPELATAIQMTGADLAQASGYSGAGVKVAVMDTGIDVDHQDLGGDGNQAAPHSFPNSRIVAGVDLVGDDYNADPESANYQPVPHPDALPDDCNGHGTHVAGIVGANGTGAAAAKGVAPGVTFGAYRVFGCAGSVTDDVMIAAMEAALEDGMHVLNMSIGDAFNNWPGSPTAAASDALVDAGMVVVASIGNSGGDGIYSAGAPGVGDKVIGVASYDNTHVQQVVFKVSPDGLGMPFSVAAASPPAPTSGTMPMAKTGTTTTADDACAPLPAGSLTGRAVLIRRGTCAFHLKSLNAQNAGAAAVVLYNNVAGALSPDRGRNAADHHPCGGDHGCERSNPRCPHRRGADDADVDDRAGDVPQPDRRPHLQLQLVWHGSDARAEAGHRCAWRFDPLDVSARGRRLRHDQRDVDGVAACGRSRRAPQGGPADPGRGRLPRHPAEQRRSASVVWEPKPCARPH